MHPTDYTNAANDMLAIRDRLPTVSVHPYVNPWRGAEGAACYAMQAAGLCVNAMIEHVDDTGPWAHSGAECVTWVEADDRFVRSSVGGPFYDAVPVTHIRVDWHDREDRHDETKFFRLRVDSREAFDTDFAAMTAELRGTP